MTRSGQALSSRRSVWPVVVVENELGNVEGQKILDLVIPIVIDSTNRVNELEPNPPVGHLEPLSEAELDPRLKCHGETWSIGE